MSNVRARFRLTKDQRTALFQEQKHGDYGREYKQTDVGATVTLSQVQGERLTPTGELSLVLNSAEAKLFHDAPMGTEFEMVISRVEPS